MSHRLVPLASDLDAALELARAALFAIPEPGFEAAAHLPTLERQMRSGRVGGRLWRSDERAEGLAVWEPPGPLGLTLRLCYLVPEAATEAGYREFLERIETSPPGTPIVFLPARLAGLSDDGETGLLRALGFARYARFEWRFPETSPLPAVEPPGGVSLHAFRPEDAAGLARVHAAAYRDHFDRYLFLSDPDPDRDAQHAVEELVEGRWGEFLPGASTVAEASGRAIAGVLVVRTEAAPLIADVATDPAFGGRGVGRAVLAESLRALRAGGFPSARLVATEGNQRALRLYERLGFVRQLGPFPEWYRTRLIPIPPGER